MEYIDILNEDGEKANYTDTRDNVHKKGLWHKSIFVWVLTLGGELLIQKRSHNKTIAPNKWTASTSGHVSAGDDSITGAVKELSEEIGLNIKKEQLEYLFTVKEQKTPKEGYIDNEIADVFLLETGVEIKDLKMQKEEVCELKLIPYKEFQKMAENKNSNLVEHTEMHNKLLKILAERY